MESSDLEVKITEKNHTKCGEIGQVVYRGIVKDDLYFWVNIGGTVTRVGYKSIEILSHSRRGE